MNWTELLKGEIASTYDTTARLIDKVDPDGLGWKPSAGSNWMTMGQLLNHIGTGCGAGCRAFLSGDWGLPPGKTFQDLPPEEMLPPAEQLPAVTSIEEARKMLAEDRAMALQAIEEAGEKELAGRQTAAPWAPNMPCALGRHFLQMVEHLEHHKSQLFYYLKLQGQSVNTTDLWG